MRCDYGNHLRGTGCTLAYANLYERVLQQKRMCLCGIMAAEASTLSVAVKDEIARFFAHNVDWLEAIIAPGMATGDIKNTDEPRAVARYIVSTLEGAMLLSRLDDDVEAFRCAVRRLIDYVCGCVIQSPRKPPRTYRRSSSTAGPNS